MRPKFLIYIFILVLVFLLVLFWKHQKQREIISESPKETSQPATTILPTIEKTNKATQTVTSPSINPQSIVNDRQKPAEVFQHYVEGKNSSLQFYGQFVDQDGNPLDGVKIKVVIRQWYVPVPGVSYADDKEIPMGKTSDNGGRFELKEEKGDSFDIVSIQKDGYEVEPGLRTYRAVGGTLEQPIIFRMWKANIHEHLITGEKKFQIVPDGRSYVIDLSRGTIAESGNGDLKVWVKYTNQVIRGQLYDWSCEIDAINGGILEENNLSSAMYSAPIEAYTPTFQFQQQIKGGQYGSSGSRRFYVMLKSGQEYGRITIELFAPYTDEISGMIHIQYAINPSDSHILKP
jgi:hypothetical protein